MASPLNPVNRLMRRVQWPAVAPYVTKMQLRFDPLDGSALGARELWRQSRSPKVVKRFSKTVVGVDIDDAMAPPLIHVDYVNGSKSALDVRGMTAEQILQRIHMDTILIAHKDDIDGVERDGIDDGPEDA